MHKAEVISRLSNHIQNDEIRMKGERSFAQFFRLWLMETNIPSDEEYDFYDIVPYLPQLVVDAWETMRTGTNSTEIEHRQMYEKEVGQQMLNLTDLGENIIEQQLGSCVLSNVVSAIAGERKEWAEDQVETYCRAQSIALQVMFDKFIRLVYRNGLFEIIQAESEQGMKGRFGSTELRTWVCAARTMFTFARPKKKGNEVSISFVGGDDDCLALDAGIQSVEANLPTAFNMIEDVIARWPKDRKDQEQIFKGSEKIAPLAVHIMRAQAKAKK
jgi:hypothetical protein